MPLKTKPVPGTRVRLTGKFLKQTVQICGGEGQSRWTVIACDCGLCSGGRHFATDEPIDPETRRIGYPDIPPEVKLWRHLALASVEIIGAPPQAADQSDAVGPIKRPLG